MIHIPPAVGRPWAAEPYCFVALAQKPSWPSYENQCRPSICCVAL